MPANTVGSPGVPSPPVSQEPSQRPPVLKFLSPKDVAACLRSDFSSYKYWL
ncbi:hypothetical protein TNCV_4067351, partial [Trichonephila clavipes]